MWSGLVLTMLSVVLLATPPAWAQTCAPPTVSVERLGDEEVVAGATVTFRFARTGDTAEELQFQFRVSTDGSKPSRVRPGLRPNQLHDDTDYSATFAIGDQHSDLELITNRASLGDITPEGLVLAVEVVGGEMSPCSLYDISQTASDASVVIVEPFPMLDTIEISRSSILYEEVYTRFTVTLDRPTPYNKGFEVEILDDQSARTGFTTFGIIENFRDYPRFFSVATGFQGQSFYLKMHDTDNSLQGQGEVTIRLTDIQNELMYEEIVEVRDPPPALESVEIEPSSILEGGRATVTVTLDRPAFSYENLSLSYEEDPYEETGRGALRTEGLGPLGEIVVPQGERSVSFFVVAPDDDNLAQDPETRQFRIKIRNEEDDYFDDRIKKQIEIRDPPPMLDSIKIEPSSIMEGGRATVTVTLDRAAPEDLYLPYDENFGGVQTVRGALETEGLDPSGRACRAPRRPKRELLRGRAR